MNLAMNFEGVAVDCENIETGAIFDNCDEQYFFVATGVLEVASTFEFRSLLWDVTRAIKPVLSVARIPSKTESVQVHWRSRRMKQTTLSIPCPSAQKERGS
jgi:hypothetical protein